MQGQQKARSLYRKTPLLSYLCDGKVQADVDDDSEEEDVEGSYDQERLLKHQDLIEVIMNLVITRLFGLLIQI